MNVFRGPKTKYQSQGGYDAITTKVPKVNITHCDDIFLWNIS